MGTPRTPTTHTNENQMGAEFVCIEEPARNQSEFNQLLGQNPFLPAMVLCMFSLFLIVFMRVAKHDFAALCSLDVSWCLVQGTLNVLLVSKPRKQIPGRLKNLTPRLKPRCVAQSVDATCRAAILEGGVREQIGVFEILIIFNCF